MSLQRTEMRRCGQRWSTREQAEHSKKVLSGLFEVVPGECLCGGFHAAAVKAPAGPGTDPTAAVRALVLDRDGWACARCGKPCGPGIAPYSLQHRIARGVGGDSSPANLVLLCGSATTGCHGEVEARKFPYDQDAGYRLESWQDPLAEGVMYFERSGSGVTRWLEADGGVLFEPPAAVTL